MNGSMHGIGYTIIVPRQLLLEIDEEPDSNIYRNAQRHAEYKHR